MSPVRKHQEQSWSNVVKVFIVVVVVSLGLWGCARQPGSKAGSSDRSRALEARCQKLEQDFRAMAAARDKARAELQQELAARTAWLKERDTLRSQVKRSADDRDELRQLLVKRTSERDELRQQITLRTSERDALQGRCEKMRKGLQTLLGQDDQQPLGAAIPIVAPSGPAVTAIQGGNS